MIKSRLGIKKEGVVLQSEEHTSELQSPCNLVCRLLLEKKKMRRLGRIRLAGDPEHEPPMSLLVFDPFISLPSAVDIQRRLAVRRDPLQAVLLHYSFLS